MWTRMEQHITNTATRRRPPRGVITEEDNFIADRMDFPYFESLWILDQEERKQPSFSPPKEIYYVHSM